MPSPSVPPPLRVREADGSPNVIPVFNLVISNGSVTKTGPTEVTIGMATGATGAPGASGGMAIGSGVTAGSIGAILFVDSNNQLAQSVSTLFFNQASTRVGIGTSAPTTELHVIGSILATSVVIGAQATSAGHLVRADRTLNTLYPVLGSGNFTTDRTVSLDTAFLVNTARTITAGVGLTGGGNLGADRTIDLFTGGAGQYVITSVGAAEGIAWIDTQAAGNSPVYAPTGGFYAVYAADGNLSAEKVIVAGSSVVITTDATQIFISALTGGAANGVIYAPTGGEYVTYVANGTLSAERVLTAGTNVTITTDASAIYVNADTGASATTVFFAPTGGEYLTYVANGTLTAERVVIAGTGLTVGSDATNFYTSVNTNIRDKMVVFFASSNLTTAHRAEEARIYIPFNMEFRDTRLAVTTTPVGANILVQVYQFANATAAGSAFYASAARASIVTGNAGGVGSGGALLNTIAYAGSWLGFSIDQVGTTSTGQDLTVTLLLRTS